MLKNQYRGSNSSVFSASVGSCGINKPDKVILTHHLRAVVVK